MRTPLLSLLVALPLVFGACSDKPKDPNGVGPWQFGRSHLEDAEAAGRCLPTASGGPMQCIGLTAMQVGGQFADVQLYFASADKKADLLEIELSVRTCDAKAVAADLQERIGPASKNEAGDMLTWSMSTMFVRALLPEKGSGSCRVNFVTPKDDKRIADLKAGN